MPSSAPESLHNTRDPAFIGLQSYTEEQAHSFFGRDMEIEDLTNLVKSNTLTIVFGKSGTGKTSLLNAGVFPKLRKDFCLPFHIRLEFRQDSPDLIAQIKNVLKEQIDKYGFQVTSYPGPETLWEYFHKELLWKTITPLLVFDQFEEMFTLAKKSSRFTEKEMDVFWEELSNLVENFIPEKLKDEFINHSENINYNYKSQKIKMLFSFREEFLPEFESITTKIPSIKYSRFRLMPMNGNQAYEVITKTWKDKIEPVQAREIVSFFTHEDVKNKSYAVMEIEPSLLSQVSTFLDKERIEQDRDKISAEFLNKYPKGIILRSIYNEVLAESNNAIIINDSELKTVNPVNVFIEDKLITNEGYRTKVALIDVNHKIKPGVEVLIGKYFLRDDGKSVELTHDVLAPIIKADREKRRKEVALAIARQKARKKFVWIMIVAILGGFLIWFIGTYKAFSDRRAAIEQKEKLDSQIVQLRKDSLKLANTNQATSVTKDSKSLPKNDSLHFYYEQNKYDSLAIVIDSLQNQYTGLQKKYNDLDVERSTAENNIAAHNSKYDELLQNLNKITTELNQLKGSIVQLRKQKYADSLKFINEYDALRRNFNAYKLNNPEPKQPVISTPLEDVPEINSLKLNLHYGSTKVKVPGNLNIYLIPFNNANKRIIRNAQVYEINCNVLELNKAKDKQIATFKNGSYSFNNVSPGKYLIKICDYYGGYYTYTKRAGDSLARFSIAPPIK